MITNRCTDMFRWPLSISVHRPCASSLLFADPTNSTSRSFTSARTSTLITEDTSTYARLLIETYTYLTLIFRGISASHPAHRNPWHIATTHSLDTTLLCHHTRLCLQRVFRHTSLSPHCLYGPRLSHCLYQCFALFHVYTSIAGRGNIMDISIVTLYQVRLHIMSYLLHITSYPPHELRSQPTKSQDDPFGATGIACNTCFQAA
ncbi:hypothetical protein QCA50_002269 [Cerrena zonata]|uniref:Uncharacterized protein n=1 Tax=Cerrena zonata TaxID=2478898 RepID=A0AAW0GZ09_9APHY